jgi:hypothetical protein
MLLQTNDSGAGLFRGAKGFLNGAALRHDLLAEVAAALVGLGGRGIDCRSCGGNVSAALKPLLLREAIVLRILTCIKVRARGRCRLYPPCGPRSPSLAADTFRPDVFAFRPDFFGMRYLGRNFVLR